MNDYGSPPTLRVSGGRSIQTGHDTYRYTNIPTNQRIGLPTNGGNNMNTAAILANDPSRVANDNAPAPFIIPARGVKPTLKNRGKRFRVYFNYKQKINKFSHYSKSWSSARQQYS